MGMRGWGNGYNDSLVLLFVVELLFESFKPSFEVGVLSVAFAGIGLEVVDLFLLGFDCFHDDGDDAVIVDRLVTLFVRLDEFRESLLDLLGDKPNLVAVAESILLEFVVALFIRDAAQLEQRINPHISYAHRESMTEVLHAAC